MTTDRNDRSVYNGLTPAEYAAIHTGSPTSGTPWLDAMIREARRAEFAKAAMQGICGDGIPGSHHKPRQTACDAVAYADELIARLEMDDDH